jgi:hypothetical protein
MFMLPARFRCAVALSAIACSWFALPISATAQGTMPASSVQPSSADPQSLLLQASQLNGLTGSDLKPWHMKVSFTLFGENGEAADTGAIEEFWAGAKKYKTIYTSSRFSQAEYGTSSGTMVSGSAHLLPDPLIWARQEITDPIPYLENRESYEHADVRLEQWDTGGLKLHCLYVFFPIPRGDVQKGRGPTYCVTNGLPVIRSSMSGKIESVRNHYVNFSGHVIPADIEIEKDKKLALKAHLETLEALDDGDSSFAPPSDARPAPIPIGQTDARKLERRGLECASSLTYPKEAGISGIVLLRVLIDPTGHVADADVIGGSSLLIPAGMDAIKRCAFAPPKKNGVPVEAIGAILVNGYSEYRF